MATETLPISALDIIKNRRAVKHFDPSHRLSKEEKSLLFEAARHSPTSFNIQNWRFVEIDDLNLRQDIREAAWNQAHITDSSLLLVICADLLAWQKAPERYWQDAPEEVQKSLVPMIPPFYAGKEQLQRDEAMRSVGIAAQTIMLAAKALNYDSCPMIGFDQDKVAKIINLPEDHIVGMIVVIGKALKPAYTKGGFLPDHEIFIKNKF